jgi:hypothetical protein
LKKSRKVGPKQKNTFFAATAVRNDRTAGLPHRRVAGPLKKSRKVGPKQKNTFFAATAVRNDPA